MAHLDLESVIGDQMYVLRDSVCHALLEPVEHGKDVYFKVTKARIFENSSMKTICSEDIGCDIYLGKKYFDGNIVITLLLESQILEIDSKMPEDNDKASEYITKVTDNLIEDGYLIITGSKTNVAKYKLKN